MYSKNGSSVNPEGSFLENIREAVAILDQRQPSFEYEGEMAPDVALNPRVAKSYPFSRLSGPANVLAMPGLQSANRKGAIPRVERMRCAGRPPWTVKWRAR